MLAPTKAASYLAQAADFIKTGTIDQNASYNSFSYISTAMRDEVSKNFGKVGSFLYNTGMSFADFLMNTAASGGNEVLALSLMGSERAADAVIEAKDRGLTDKQAFTLGTISGAIEIATEKLSLGALLDMTKLSKSISGYLISNVLAEGSEEVVSNVGNLIADVLVSKDKSQWQMSIDNYIEDGYSGEAALNMAFKDQAVSMGLDFLGGALSGGFGGGGAVAVTSAANTAANAKAAASIGKTLQESGQYNALLNEALKLNKNSDAYQLASKLQSGKMKATAKNIGNLFTRYVRAGGDIGSFVASAAAQHETNTIGETLSAMDSGTLALFAHLFNTDSSQSVLSELNQGKRPSNELLKQFADETGLAKRALDVNQAFQSEQSALSDLRQAQARYGSENTPQARSALIDAQAAYDSAVGKLNAAAKEVGINSAEGLQNLRNALGGTEAAALPERAGAVNSPVQIVGYGEEVPSGLSLPGAELFAQDNAAYSGNEVPTLTLPGAELFAQENTLNTPVDTSPQNGNMDVGGQLAINGTQIEGTGNVGLDPDILIDTYKNMRNNPDIVGQAHHLNQNAAFKDLIPKNDGLCVELGGNAFKDIASPHYSAHKNLESFWNDYRLRGIHYGSVPTISNYNSALYISLRAAGLSDVQATKAVQSAINQQLRYGLVDNSLVPSIPGRIRFKNNDAHAERT